MKKKVCFTISFVLFSLLLSAQNEEKQNDEIILEVFPFYSVENNTFCTTSNLRKDAIVIEFDVINETDIKKFGNKIYAISIYEENPSKESFKLKDVFELKISEIQYFCWNIKIFNEELIDKNRNKEKFWVRDL